MASDKNFVEFVMDKIENAGALRSRSMFGEYAIYANEKLFCLVCDNKVFIKPTQAGRDFIENVLEAPPYPGAKPCFLIEEKLEDREWFSQLVRITVKELPEPKPKKKKSITRKKRTQKKS